MTKTLSASLLALSLGLAGCGGTPYVAAGGGAQIWPDRSNHDRLEADAAPGVSASLAGGLQLSWGRAELELAHRINGIHGRNPDGFELSAEDDLHASSATLNVWPEVRLTNWASLYVGGSAGPALIQALGDQAVTVSLQGGAGVVLRPAERIFLDLGYRYFWTKPVDVDGLRSEFDTHGPQLRLGVTFDTGPGFLGFLTYKADREPIDPDANGVRQTRVAP